MQFFNHYSAPILAALLLVGGSALVLRRGGKMRQWLVLGAAMVVLGAAWWVFRPVAGVAVDEWGKTSIDNLYAIGEVSCTGLHGANRLASTSLLEGLVWGDRAGRRIDEMFRGETPPIPTRDDVPAWDESGLTKESDPALIMGDMQTIQNIMWHYVGLVRSGDRIARAIRVLRHLQGEIETFYRRTKLSDGRIGLRNAVEVALIIAQAAYHNRQSRGCHYRADAVEAGERLL